MAQINKGDTFVDGQSVTGARLNALVDSATLAAGAITDQTNITANTVASGDSILLYDLSATALREANVSDVLGSNLPVTTSAITGGAGVNVVITPAATYKVDVAGAFEADSSNIVGNETVGGALTVTGTTALNGTSTAVTKAANTNTTDIATTAYVVGQAGTATPITSTTAAVGTSLRYAREDHSHAIDNPIKAWCRFTAGDSPDPKASRTAGSNTCTIQNQYGIVHGLTSGQKVMFFATAVAPASVIIPAGAYVVTVTSTTAFTIQTVATTVLTNAYCNWYRRFDGFNISGLTKNADGDYTATFTNSISTDYFAYSGFAQNNTSNYPLLNTLNTSSTTSVRFQIMLVEASQSAPIGFFLPVTTGFTIIA